MTELRPYFAINFDYDACDNAEDHIQALVGFRVRITDAYGNADDYIIDGTAHLNVATGHPIMVRLSRGPDGDPTGEPFVVDACTLTVY